MNFTGRPSKPCYLEGENFAVFCPIKKGHRIKNSGDWIQLFDENHFIQSTVDWIKNIKHHELRKLQKEARDFAEKNYKWEKIVDELSQILSKQS